MKLIDLVWVAQRLADSARQEMRVHYPGVPTAEFVIMRLLVEGPPSTITSLAGRSGYAQSHVSTVVSSLVDRGWAQTTRDPADGRRTLVLAPDPIRRVADQALNAEARTIHELLADHPPARRAVIVDALDELLKVMRAQSEADSTSPPG